MPQITNLTKQRIPKIPWKKIKEKVLGKKYELSLVLAPNALMRKLNSQYRGEDKPASVLSFPLSDNEAPRLHSGQGEIFINLIQKKHTPLRLFIHAVLHLKRFKHGARMEEQERKLTSKYGARDRYRP